MRFKKGEGGRPRGIPNKSTREIRALATRLVTDAAYRKALKERLIAGTAPQMETLLHHYAYGKPTERIEHTGKDGGPIQVHDHFALPAA